MDQDPAEPGEKGALTSIARQTLPCLDESFLSQVGCLFGVPTQEHRQAEKTGCYLIDERGKGVGIACSSSCDQVAVSGVLRGQCLERCVQSCSELRFSGGFNAISFPHPCFDVNGRRPEFAGSGSANDDG